MGLQQVLSGEPFWLFAVLPACAVFRGVVLAFFSLCQRSSARDRRSSPATRVGAVVISFLFRLSTARDRERGPVAERWREASWPPLQLAPFRPMLSPFHLMLSRARPGLLSVGQVVVQQSNLVFGRNKSSQKRRARTGQKVFSYQE